MKRTRMWLALATAAWLPLTAAAAPAPPPPSQGPISDALELRGSLPKTTPPSAASAVTAGEGVLQLETQVLVPVETVAAENVTQPDGKKVQVERVVTEMRAVPQTQEWKVDGVTFFLVGKGGKLEAIPSAKATAMLKQKTPVLTGDSADVDPRNLEVVNPGTLYLVLPQPQLQPPGIPIAPQPPEEKKP